MRSIVFARSATSLGVSPHRLCVAQHCLRKAQHRFVSAKAERCFRSAKNDVASKLANDVVSCGHKHKKKDTIFIVSFFLVRVTGLEPASLATHEPESCVFANFTIPAKNARYIITFLEKMSIDFGVIPYR